MDAKICVEREIGIHIENESAVGCRYIVRDIERKGICSWIQNV